MRRVSGDVLTGVGGGDGTEEMAADYSLSNGVYTFGPPANETWAVSRGIVYISDGGAAAPTEFGNSAALSNGYSIAIYDEDGAAVRELANGYLFKTNGDFARVMYDVQNLGAGAGGDDAYAGRWTWLRAGTYLVLRGDRGHKLGIDLSDDLSVVNSHTWYIDAVKVSGGVT